MQYGHPIRAWHVFFPLAAATWLEATGHVFELEHGYDRDTGRASCSFLNVRFRSREEARVAWSTYRRAREEAVA